jgi:hypothetical protein
MRLQVGILTVPTSVRSAVIRQFTFVLQDGGRRDVEDGC